MSAVKVGHRTRSGKEVVEIRAAGADHQVVSTVGAHSGYMKKPCALCPWRVDATGEFPAEAFKHSASTSYDMSDRIFACHDSGVDKGKTCAGFLLRGADNNLAVRLGYMSGKYHRDVKDGGHELHDSYRDMAVANGVDPDDEVLRQCRP